MKEAHLSRRGFLSGTAASARGAGFALALPSEILAQSAPQAPAKPPRLNLEMVQEFVRVGHFDLDRTKALLAQEPGLLNAAWDWGVGDWETALGGAGHMGRKDIALFLISSGARMDIFHAARLGRLDIVKPMLTAFPNLAASKGPHGITLMAHAQKGGEEAVAVVRFRSLFPSRPETLARAFGKRSRPRFNQVQLRSSETAPSVTPACLRARATAEAILGAPGVSP